MTKLYYTDALKAAWMSREFGVLTYCINDDGNETDDDFYAYLEAAQEESAFPFYVHPDSLSIFEPMEGDVVSYWYESEPDYHCSTAKRTREHIKRLTKAKMFYVKHQSGISRMRIIQRNGKAFFMPEVEA